MKPVLFITVLALCSLISCKQNKPTDKTLDMTDVSQLNDTVSKLVHKYIQAKDTFALNMALLYTDEIISVDTVKENAFRNYSTKIQVLNLLGRNYEAFYLQDKILPKDENNIDRLIYNGVCFKLEKNQEEAQKCFDKALKECDNILAKDDNIDTRIKKISIYTYQGDKTNAKKFIDLSLGKYPIQRSLTMLKESYDSQFDEVAAFLEGKK